MTLTSQSKPFRRKGTKRLSTLKRRIARAQQRLRRFVKPGRSLSDELIAERREAARNE
jgi:hypothetical protein